MYSSLILLAIATLSQAFYYPLDGDAQGTMVNSRLFRRNKGYGEIKAKDVCVLKILKDNPSVWNQVLDKNDLAHCQARLLQWAQNADSKIQSTGGGPGLQITYQSVSCQVCNFGSQQHVDATNLITLFTAIDSCGTQDAPTMGFGYSDKLNDDGYYVSYAPAGHLQNCYPRKKSHNSATGLEDAD